MTRLDALRLVLVTDGVGDTGRIRALVTAAVGGGVRAVQLREPGLGARALAALCEQLRPMLVARDGLLLVNDRADVVAAGVADGVHLGQRSLPVAAARRVVGDGALIGVSAHDAAELRAPGADYASLSPVFPTSCKPGAPSLGLDRTRQLVRATALPVVWLGGFDEVRIRTVAGHAPFGIAVRSALCDASDPTATARSMITALAGARPLV